MKITVTDRIRGYEAAAIRIKQALDKAESKSPRREVDTKSAACRRGVHDAFLTCHCWMVFGVFPHSNKDSIDRALHQSKSLH